MSRRSRIRIEKAAEAAWLKAPCDRNPAVISPESEKAWQLLMAVRVPERRTFAFLSYRLWAVYLLLVPVTFGLSLLVAWVQVMARYTVACQEAGLGIYGGRRRRR